MEQEKERRAVSKAINKISEELLKMKIRDFYKVIEAYESGVTYEANTGE